MHATVLCLDEHRLRIPQAFLDKLHGDGQQWVPIVDPGILIDPGYPAYDEGLKDDIFVKDASGQPYHGQVKSLDGFAPGFYFSFDTVHTAVLNRNGPCELARPAHRWQRLRTATGLTSGRFHGSKRV